MFSDRLKDLQNNKILNTFSGVILIKEKNKTLFSFQGGYANRSWKVPNTIQTKFRIASVSKMFTAVAITQLIDEGLLDFDTKITDLINLENTNISKDVTIHHLLTHTSGIADYYDESTGDEGWNKLWSQKPIYNVRTLRDYFELFYDKKPIGEVGIQYKYNNAGYILLGMAIEELTRKSYFSYVEDNIFNKIGMDNSCFINLDEVHENVAEGYEIIDGAWLRNIYTTTPTPASDGGATSTAEDLIKFIQGLRHNKLLNEENTRKILTPYVIDEESNGFRNYIWKYGYANNILLDEYERIVRGGHTGEEYGVSSRVYYYPSLGIDIVILSNVGFSAGKVGWAIHDLLIS